MDPQAAVLNREADAPALREREDVRERFRPRALASGQVLSASEERPEASEIARKGRVRREYQPIPSPHARRRS
jgi:hypothetical protein